MKLAMKLLQNNIEDQNCGLEFLRLQPKYFLFLQMLTNNECNPQVKRIEVMGFLQRWGKRVAMNRSRTRDLC
jgi:hypothetical protein